MSKLNKTSDFWLGSDLTDRYYDPITGVSLAPKGRDIFAMVGYQKAISNFVRIVTGENVPVKFNTKDDSYTDGKSVVLSGNIKSGNFDVAVGLALHEGSHIKLTDFSHLKNGIDNYISAELVAKATTKGITKYELSSIVKNFLNIVEDRRIDKYIQTEAPGYRGYYEAMYDHYFNDVVIDKALKARVWNEETVEHYFNHVVNFINPNRTLDLLTGLVAIWKAIDLQNISRLKTTTDALNIALEVTDIMLNQLPDVKQEDDKGQGEGESDENENGENEQGEGTGSGSGQGESEEQDGESDDQDGESDDQDGESDDQDGEGDGNDSGETAEGEDSKDKGNSLTPKEVEKLKKAIEKQKEFTEGKTKKTNIQKKEKQLIEAVKSSDASIEKVDYTHDTYYGDSSGVSEVTVIRKMSESTSGLCSMYRKGRGYSVDAVKNGMRLGAMLGKKLQVRNDNVTIQHNRQRKGKIDRRLLAEFGMGNAKIFEQTFTTNAKNASVHVSIDASGSMGGKRWDKAMTTAVAIAKAADMVGGVRVKIDFRSDCGSQLNPNRYGSPTVMLAYDSKVNKLNHIRKYFGDIDCTGGTPEGLCFKAIMDIINEGDRNTDKYFINLSDGAPSSIAINPTTQAVKTMKQNGISVLSYLVDGRDNGKLKELFTKMYGVDSASFVDTANIMLIAKTLNKLLSKRG